MIHIGILMGGKSPEHNISLRSGTFMYNVLDRSLFFVKPILISKSGTVYYPMKWNLEWDIDSSFDTTSNEEEFAQTVLESFQRNLSPVSGEIWKDPFFGGCEVIAIGLHGGEGEDGRIQSFLELSGVPYTGSGVLASALAMDKYRSNLLFRQAGLQVAEFFEISSDLFNRVYDPSYPGRAWERLLKESGVDLEFPVFTKPTTGGSSVNTFCSYNEREWEIGVSEICAFEKRILVQKLIQGREVSCGVLEIPSDGAGIFKPKALPPTEIRPKSHFFDYNAKYTIGASLEITPPDMPESWIDSLQKASVKAHQILGCEGYSRTDFIVSDDGIPWILETNTLPGMTRTSIIPQQAAKAQIDMKQIFTWLIQLALERRGIPKPWE